MIYDVLENSHLYFEKGSRLAKACEFVRSFDLSQPDGRYEIDGENMYATVASYQTKPAEQLKFEAHKKYIDVQALISGCERIDVFLFPERLVVDTPYNEARDITFYKPANGFVPLIMNEGIFAVLYPHDAHRPSCNFDSQANVRKIVVKVAL